MSDTPSTPPPPIPTPTPTATPTPLPCAEPKPGCQCEACRGGVQHDSDCAVHNMPAYANGPCNCGAVAPPPPEQGPEPIPFPPQESQLPPPETPPEPPSTNAVPGRLYLDCVDVQTGKPTRLELPTKFPVLAKDMAKTLEKWPAMKDQIVVLLTYSAMKGADGKQTLVEQRITSGPFAQVLGWVKDHILSKEDAAAALMQTLAQIANCSRLRLVTVTLLDEDEQNRPISGGFTMMFVPESEFADGELIQHYRATTGHAEEFREKAEKSRKISLGLPDEKTRILKPGDAGFKMPPRGKRRQ